MNTKVTLVVLVGVALVGCAGTVSDSDIDSDLMTGAQDEQGSISSELSSGVPIGSKLKTTSALNLRTGAGMGYRVRLVIPNGGIVTTVNRSTPAGGWYNVKYNGIVGWAYGSYLKVSSAPSTPSSGGGGDIYANTRDGAIKRAHAGVGFSYWWGHGRFAYGGVSSSAPRGACYGSCPNCRHTGSWGGDCSGFVGKVWEVAGAMSTDSHPYSTWSYMGASSKWRSIARSSARKADAFVYNSGGAGHIFVFESGDGWGSMWASECKGCSYGCVRNLRTASSAYKAIAHY